jgi:predicted house-cleaning NTP pyrophosphatase (Maf/HAM1 superfamily)
LRGRWHQVITGVAVIDGGRGRIAIGHEQTHVLMRAYSDEEIAAYVASGDPMDKAAAYGIQHPTFNPVETIATCYTNVMGLPLCLVADLLALFGGGLERPLDLRTPQCPWCIQARAMNGPPGRGSGA